MAKSSIKNIENQLTVARKETLIQLRDAFDSNGVKFLPGAGVTLKDDGVAVYQGRGATTALYENIYTTAQTAHDREVCILGLDEAFSSLTDGMTIIQDHVARLTRAGICERILVCEGDTTFVNVPSSYRWLPRQYFSRTSPVYLFGDKLAFHTGNLRRRTTVIEDRHLTHHLKKIFNLLWDTAIIPPGAEARSP